MRIDQQCFPIFGITWDKRENKRENALLGGKWKSFEGKEIEFFCLSLLSINLQIVFFYFRSLAIV